jgi:hypothetical protein
MMSKSVPQVYGSVALNPRRRPMKMNFSGKKNRLHCTPLNLLFLLFFNFSIRIGVRVSSKIVLYAETTNH